MYADETTLFTTINCFENNEHPNQYINSELSKISEWLIVNKLSLNASKTKCMVFIMPQKKVVILESVDQFNFLGITLDNLLLHLKSPSDYVGSSVRPFLRSFVQSFAPVVLP